MSSSNILITDDAAAKLRGVLEGNKYSKVCVLTDENTEKHCLNRIASVLPEKNIIRVKSGEEAKNIRSCETIWQQMTDMNLDRKALLINLGGGVIGDMGGFCASTYKRGIDFIQIPTTLLSQVDASVGGKLGVDFNNFKNHIGVFKEPKAVIIDSQFLKTLDKREIRSGYAEVIKHCLIADKAKWEEISKKTKLVDLSLDDLVRHSINVKYKVTQADPFEKGLRKILNFGHTIGHAVESHFLNIPDKRLLHGEAIAIGMICESYISKEKGFISDAQLKQIRDYLIAVYGKYEIFDFDIEKMLPLVFQDKKNDKNIIQCTLLEKIGKANYNNPISIKEIRESLNYYNS